MLIVGILESLLMPKFGRLLAVSLALSVGSCEPGGDLPPLAQPAGGPYRLGSGDEIRLIVYGDEQLSGQYHVDDQGYVSVPLLGEVDAAGLTQAQLGDAVASDLVSRKLINSPSVSVDVLQYRPIYVLGEVEHPGSFPYQPGLTMLSAVALAGGFTYRGVSDRAAVVRTTHGVAVQGRVDPGSFLQPGDVVTIYERFF